MPPPKLRFMGDSEEKFERIGNELADGLEQRAGLDSHSGLLDIGCGYGRLAYALQQRDFQGSYLGIDVLERQVRWCSKSLGRRQTEDGGAFEFRRVDIGNDRYNPEGHGAITDLDLGDGRFDVITAFSVFTHMWPDDVTAYFDLAARHLKPGGRFQATFFLMDDEWRALVESGGSQAMFGFEHAPHCRFHDGENPLHMVAYELDWVLEQAKTRGLEPAGPPVYGLWSRRPLEIATPPFQDELTFRRAS